VGSGGRNFLLFKYFVFTRFSFYSNASWCAYLAALFFFHTDVTLTKRCAGDKNNTTQTDASLSRSTSNLLRYRLLETKLCRKLFQQATSNAPAFITFTSTYRDETQLLKYSIVKHAQFLHRHYTMQYLRTTGRYTEIMWRVTFISIRGSQPAIEDPQTLGCMRLPRGYEGYALDADCWFKTQVNNHQRWLPLTGRQATSVPRFSGFAQSLWANYETAI